MPDETANIAIVTGSAVADGRELMTNSTATAATANQRTWSNRRPTFQGCYRVLVARIAERADPACEARSLIAWLASDSRRRTP